MMLTLDRAFSRCVFFTNSEGIEWCYILPCSIKNQNTRYFQTMESANICDFDSFILILSQWFFNNEFVTFLYVNSVASVLYSFFVCSNFSVLDFLNKIDVIHNDFSINFIIVISLLILSLWFLSITSVFLYGDFYILFYSTWFLQSDPLCYCYVAIHFV